MRNHVVRSIALVFTVASLIAVSSGCSKVRSQPSNSQTDQSSGQTSGQSSGQSSTSASNQQTVEGCVVREHSTIYVQPATGDRVKVSSSDQDLNSQVGKNVRATGTMGSSTSGSSSGSTGSTSSQSSTGAGGSADNADALLVTKVDVVDQTCPPDIQKRIDSDKKNNPNNPK